ncbi:MAG: ABC transporter permease [Lachnospiraceae bacterium]|nr:ABC transporter permease [Lachnospiraceae bacterium]
MQEERIGRVGQIKIYTGKCFRLFVSEKQWTNWVSTAIIMGIIMLVVSEDMFVAFSDTKMGFFAMICACIWVGLFNSIRSICRERAIIKREHRTGLHISSYILAHVIYEAAICVVEGLIVLAMVFIKCHAYFPVAGLVFPALVDLYITFWLTIFGADMIAVMISSIVKSENTAMTVMPFVLIIQLVMSGAVFTLKGVTEAISYFTLSKWGLSAVCAVANTIDSLYWRYLASGVDGYDPTAGNLLCCWLYMAVFTLVYIIISIIALKQVDRDKR